MADELKPTAEDKLTPIDDTLNQKEQEIEMATGIKGSKGSWASEHPGLIVAAVALVLAFFLLKGCFGF